MKRVFAHIGFSFALTMLILNLIEIKFILPIVIGLAVVFIASLIIKKYRQALAVPICLGTALFACLIFLFSYNSVVVPEQNLSYKNAECEFYIIDLSQKDEDEKYSYLIKTQSINLPSSPQNIKLRLKTDEPLEAEAYQLIKGNLTFYKIGSNAFSSYGYWGKNIFLSSTLGEYSVSDTYKSSLMKYIIKARQEIKSRLGAINGDEGALSVALIIGDKSGISDKLYNDFKFSGASHLMAVSGLHLTAITGFILFLLKKLRIRDKASFGITIAVIIFYCALCSFSKSVVRAGIMMSVLMIGKILGRHSDSLNSLGLAAFIICINPFAVCDIGAVLSILCVLSLCTAYPYFNGKISRFNISEADKINDIIIYLLKALVSALCIMAYSLPAMFVFFGYVSPVSLISNIVLIPLGSFAITVVCPTFFGVTVHVAPLALLTATMFWPPTFTADHEIFL